MAKNTKSVKATKTVKATKVATPKAEKATKAEKKPAAKTKPEAAPKAKGELTEKQVMLLKVLAKAKAPMSRPDLHKATGMTNGWTRNLGLIGSDPREDSLIGLGFVKTVVTEESATVGHVITASGKAALAKAGK